MITIEKNVSIPVAYPLERLGNPKDLLFFDIETTGFSGASSSLYLIGCISYQNGRWKLIQWFADSPSSEAELLHAFFSFLKEFKTLIHFNGDRFDIPYLQKRCLFYHLPYDFTSVKSIDIYRKIKPYQKLLGLNSLKQKAIEGFLNISRKDLFTGGELIQVYEDYLISHNIELCDLLLLHNEDDLKGMPALLPILSYPDFFETTLSLTDYQICQEKDSLGNPLPALRLSCQGDCKIPVPFRISRPPVICSVRNNTIIFSIELFEGTLKHFYPDYKDYYYLIYEDTAVHKSIGEYVDKSARVKATAKTCYTKKEGIFLPQFSLLWEPVMKKEPRDKLSYIPLSDSALHDSSRFQCYLAQLFYHLGVKRNGQ